MLSFGEEKILFTGLSCQFFEMEVIIWCLCAKLSLALSYYRVL